MKHELITRVILPDMKGFCSIVFKTGHFETFPNGNPVAPQAVGRAAWPPVRIEISHSADVPYLQGNACFEFMPVPGSPVP